MDEAFARKLELSWKAIWAGDVSRAYDLLESIAPDEDVDPMLAHDIRFNLAVFSSLLHKDRAAEYRTKIKSLYETAAKYYPKTMKERLRRPKQLEELRERTPKMSLEEELSFFISPGVALRELDTAIEFAREFKVAEIHTLGMFRYSFEG